jgi:chromosome partition protein MukE
MTASLPPETEPIQTSSQFTDLGDVVNNESFPLVDLALRRGRHIHRDEDLYAFLIDAQALLEHFYRRFGCELVHKSDGYFFLLPVNDDLGKRHLSVAEMIVGQGLALMYLDPTTVEKGGVITREELLGQLASVMGTDALMRTLNPKRKKPDERVMQRTVRQKVVEALRRLSGLGFVELLEGDQLRLPASLLRFAEPVRGLEAPSEALAKMLQRGEVNLGPGDDDTEPGEPLEDAEADDGMAEELADDDAPADASADPGSDELARGPEGADADGSIAEQDEPWMGEEVSPDEPRADTAESFDDFMTFDNEGEPSSPPASYPDEES